MLAYGAALVVIVVLGGALAAVGVGTLRDSNAGRRVASADPSDPGFEGLLEPTPTLVIIHAADDDLLSVAVLALGAGGKGGSVLVVPPDILLGGGPSTLSLAQSFGAPPEGMRALVEQVTTVGLQEVVVVDDARWAALVDPVAPLTVENPDGLDAFPTGTIELAAEDVGPWLAAVPPGGSATAHVFRQQLFWERWLAAVAEAGADAHVVPGELESGIGRFIRGLAAGRVDIAAVPVIEQPTATGTETIVDTQGLRSMITDLVPYPSGSTLAPRTRVRLLDGTGDAGHATRVARTVVAQDASIVVVGNAESFDYETTEIRYHQPAQKDAAERLAAALGVGQVIEDVRPIDAFDVTIVLGTDI
jgi:hypothetical protein